MCLIAFAWNAHPRYSLVIVANRDEFHQRPTEPLQEWLENPGVIGGRDLREGGGWLALSRTGKLAAVTNVREPNLKPALRSRGALVRDYVSGDQCAVARADLLSVEAADYGPFNLLLWDGLDLVYTTNRPTPHWTGVRPGVHGLSNGYLDAPWPKARRLSASLQTWLDQPQDMARGTDPDLQPLFAALADEQGAADAELPVTGVGIDTERRLASPFIRGAAYGTRASSVVLIHRDGRANFIERRFGPEGSAEGETRIDVELGRGSD